MKEDEVKEEVKEMKKEEEKNEIGTVSIVLTNESKVDYTNRYCMLLVNFRCGLRMDSY